ncbi:MAG: DNA cytosine methyltransferase [Heliobacteriaceae bacterium]|jgi:DNA (cytosine-5)-methyltransferase 1|nr:DNA cytosine methyltransferase [Heliobacteriaceae bacterium]
MVNKKKENSIKVFDFFSGCGGTSAGLQKAGMDVVLALDTDKDAIETFQKNIRPEKTVCEDIRKVEINAVKEFVDKYNKTHYILFCGCAPCQPFSSQNKKRFSSEDKRIDLLSEFLRFVKECNPDFILCENVPGLQKIDKDGPLPNFIKNLKNMGYNVPEPKIVHAQDYGVPQRRKRLVLIASKLGEPTYPRETRGSNVNKPYKTVRDAIYNLPKINAGEEHFDKKKYPNHQTAGLQEINLKRLQQIKAGQGRKDWSKELYLECHKKHDGHSDVYGRLEWDQPAVTLTTRCTSISNGRFGHPEQDRAISVREAACLQTFPKQFKFYGSGLGSLARQVGNAVPVELAKAFGKMFTEHCKQAG